MSEREIRRVVPDNEGEAGVPQEEEEEEGLMGAFADMLKKKLKTGKKKFAEVG